MSHDKHRARDAAVRFVKERFGRSTVISPATKRFFTTNARVIEWMLEHRWLRRTRHRINVRWRRNMLELTQRGINQVSS